MSLESGIFSLLTSDSTVSGQVGTRVYPTELAEGATWPAIVYSIPETNREPTLLETGVPRSRVMVRCYAEQPPAAISLAGDVAEVLADYHGAADDVKIIASNFIEQRDGWDYEKSESGLYFREVVFDIFYRD